MYLFIDTMSNLLYYMTILFYILSNHIYTILMEVL